MEAIRALPTDHYIKQRPTKKTQPTVEDKNKKNNPRYGSDSVLGQHQAKVEQERQAWEAEFQAVLNDGQDLKAIKQAQVDIETKKARWEELDRGLSDLELKLLSVRAAQGKATTADEIISLRKQAEMLTVAIPATRYEMLLAKRAYLEAQAPTSDLNIAGLRRLQEQTREELNRAQRKLNVLNSTGERAKSAEQQRRANLRDVDAKLEEVRGTLHHEATQGSGLKQPGAISSPPAGVPYQGR